MDTRITTVILDFGGVLGLPQDPVRVATMSSLCGLSVERFLAAYQPDRLELDRGTLSPDRYWERILAGGGVAPSPPLVERLEREDALGWARTNRPVVAWSAELRAAGYRTAILSNMPPDKLSFIRASREFSWIDDFEATFFSCDYRMVKPEAAFYQVCLSTLVVSPGECLFVDDAPVNAGGARAAGMQALVFGSAPEAAAEISRTWKLPVRSLLDHAGG